MKPERAFVAERRAAQHCAELLRPAPAPGELMPRFGQLGERLADALAPLLASLTAGEEAPKLKAGPAHQDDDLLFAAEVGALAANCLFAVGSRQVPLLVSIQAGAVLAMVDRTFGGRGEAPDPMPQRFPLSAELLIARIEEIIARALVEAMGLGDPAQVQVLRRDGSLAALKPFAEGAPLAALRIEVREDDGEPWPIHVALAETGLADLVADGGGTAPARMHGRADPHAEPFAGLPLELTATLVDMRMALSSVAAIAPGMVLPVAVSRHVPIRIGGKLVASGTVGAADDRVALRITEAFT